MLVFSGFGAVNGSLLGRLRDFHSRPGSRAVLVTACDAVERALAHVGPDVTARVLPRGLPLRTWLTGSAPPPQDLQHSVVEGVLTHVYQLCLLQPDGQPDSTEPAAAEPVVGLGHSLGVVSATVAGLRLGPVEFVRQAHDSVLFVTLGLLRAHQVADPERPDPALVRRYLAQAGPGERPSPMAALTGVDRADLSALLDAHGDASVGIGLVNSSRSVVLTGGAAPLLRLWAAHEERWRRDGAGWSFVRATAPFHSPVLAPALPLAAADRAALAEPLPGERLQFPVWSMDGGYDLAGSADLVRDCIEQVFCRPVDWSAAVGAAVASGPVEQVLDYGPGVAVRVFTKESLGRLGLSPSITAVKR